MNLYEINSEILSCIDAETGEVLDEAKLHELLIAREDKLEGLACWVKNLESDAVALKAEKKSFEERIARTEKLIASIKETLARELAGQKFSTAKVAVSFRRSEKVDVAESAITSLPPEFLTMAEPKPNKTEIKRFLKSGGTIDGCTLTEHQNIQIK